MAILHSEEEYSCCADVIYRDILLQQKAVEVPVQCTLVLHYCVAVSHWDVIVSNSRSIVLTYNDLVSNFRAIVSTCDDINPSRSGSNLSSREEH